MTLKRAWLILGIVTTITAVIAILKNKIAAVLLGPEGIGVLAQGTVFIAFGVTICSLGMGQGIVKHLAERQTADVEDITTSDIISTSLALQLVMSVVVVVFILLFSRPIGILLFGNDFDSRFVVLSALAIPITLLSLNFGYLLQGAGQIGRYSLASIINVIVSLIIFFYLVQTERLYGAVLSLLIIPLAGNLIFLMLSSGKLIEIWYRKPVEHVAKFLSTRVAKILLIYGAVTFLAAALESLNAVVIRSWIINVSGAEQNGIYQAVLGLTGQYIGFFSLFNATYLFPKMSALREPAAIGIETNKALQLGLLFITPLLALFLIFRDQIILLLFTPAFLAASNILVWQALGDFLKISSWTISSSLLPMGKLRQYVTISIVYSALTLSLSIIFLYRWQTVGIAIAYFVTYAISIAVVIGIQRKVLNLRFSSLTLRLAAVSTVTLGLIAFFSNETVFHMAFKTAIVLIWGIYAIWEMRFQIQSLVARRVFARIRT